MKTCFLLVLGVLIGSVIEGAAAETEAPSLPPAVVSKIGSVLADRRLAEPPPTTRGGSLSDLYRSSVLNVPVVLCEGGSGSSVVMGVKDGRASVITNNHVAEHAFTVEGRPAVALLFYSPALKNELFSSNRFVQCFGPAAEDSEWCQAVRASTRLASVVRTDPSRDLALLSVAKVPSGVTGFSLASPGILQPGDTVAAIGHPVGLLWSLTTGIVSAVRTNMLLGTGYGTVVQTQAAVNPGNSGGPLIGTDGKVVGVVFGAKAGQTFRIGTEELTMRPEGLNYAIGIDTVLTFTRSAKALTSPVK